MSLLKSLLTENAAAGATAAHSIASGGGHETTTDLTSKKKDGTLWTGGVVNGKKRNVLKRIINMPHKKVKYFESVAFLESLGVHQDSTDFDASDVLSKIDSAQKKETLNDDTTAFGLEDDEGNLVKVYVQNDQAEDFESKLAAMLAGELENDEQENTAPEIAEVLYKLKDEFDIVDVEWPGIVTDEEEEQEVAGAGGGEMPAGGGQEAGGMPAGDDGAAPGDGEIGDDLGLEDAEGEDDLGLDGEGDMEADEGAKSALQDVIDVMKANAEAQLADAEARTAEARAKEAEYTSQAASSRVKREEQVYDMETAEKEQKDMKKYAEQQSKLARFQYNNDQDMETKLSMESVEDDEDDEITLTELRDLILKNLRHQG